jgi:hypothetical protein
VRDSKNTPNSVQSFTPDNLQRDTSKAVFHNASPPTQGLLASARRSSQFWW